MTKTGLVLVDIQNDYFENGLWPVEDISAAAKNAARLLAASRHAGHAVIHIQHAMPNAEVPFFRPGSHGEQIHDMVAPKGDEAVVLKARPSSFVGTELDKLLSEAGVEKIVVCGAMSQMCIDSTVRDASDRGYDVTVVEDACGAKEVAFKDEVVPASMVHKTIMGALAGGFAAVVSTEDALKQL